MLPSALWIEERSEGKAWILFRFWFLVYIVRCLVRFSYPWFGFIFYLKLDFILISDPGCMLCNIQYSIFDCISSPFWAYVKLCPIGFFFFNLDCFVWCSIFLLFWIYKTWFNLISEAGFVWCVIFNIQFWLYPIVALGLYVIVSNWFLLLWFGLFCLMLHFSSFLNL